MKLSEREKYSKLFKNSYQDAVKLCKIKFMLRIRTVGTKTLFVSSVISM